MGKVSSYRPHLKEDYVGPAPRDERAICGNDLIDPAFNHEIKTAFNRAVAEPQRTRRRAANFLTCRYGHVSNFPIIARREKHVSA